MAVPVRTIGRGGADTALSVAARALLLLLVRAGVEVAGGAGIRAHVGGVHVGWRGRDAGRGRTAVDSSVTACRGRGSGNAVVVGCSRAGCSGVVSVRRRRIICVRVELATPFLCLFTIILCPSTRRAAVGIFNHVCDVLETPNNEEGCHNHHNHQDHHARDDAANRPAAETALGFARGGSGGNLGDAGRDELESVVSLIVEAGGYGWRNNCLDSPSSRQCVLARCRRDSLKNSCGHRVRRVAISIRATGQPVPATPIVGLGWATVVIVWARDIGVRGPSRRKTSLVLFPLTADKVKRTTTRWTRVSLCFI